MPHSADLLPVSAQLGAHLLDDVVATFEDSNIVAETIPPVFELVFPFVLKQSIEFDTERFHLARYEDGCLERTSKKNAGAFDSPRDDVLSDHPFQQRTPHPTQRQIYLPCQTRPKHSPPKDVLDCLGRLLPVWIWDTEERETGV